MAELSGRFLLTASFVGISLPLFTIGIPGTLNRPNVVIFLLDEKGYGDIFCYNKNQV